jgi:ABC-type dipeptide/oligopeptide/nickel transport system ATPase subunit
LLHETAQIEAAELNADLHRASELAARMRIDGDATGSRLAAIELGPFQLPNPGGGADLLDDAVLTLTPGHRYGLIGRNGKGKSTLLKFLASRRVGGLDPSVSVHYVTQEVSLTETQENALPADVVLAADIERVILLQEVVKMEAQDRADLDLEDETGGGGGKGGLKKENPLDAEARRKKLAAAHERLIAMDANGAPARASHILRNLGFNESLSNRKLKDLSGGWRVRVALAAALFAKPYVLRVSQILTPTFDALYGVQSDSTTTAIRATQYRTVYALYKSPITRLATDLFLSHSQRFAVTRRTDEPPFNRGGALAGEGAVDLENVANANRGGGVPRPSLPGRRHHGLAAHQRRRAATHAAQDVLQRVGGEEGGAAEEFGKAAISAGGEEETPGGVRGARV